MKNTKRYRVFDYAGDVMTLPKDTTVFYSKEVAIKRKPVKFKQPTLYACDESVTYRWGGSLMTRIPTEFTRVDVTVSAVGKWSSRYAF